ncbi:hypothetical protein [Longispora fulva]|uniref:Uncharacterized protein n=1 Tax=Longispora fulva TaxID=619741 RepID=A0A8J7GDJ2_9ACTN|nr:hypothetical protein [Longispora fulva]MBG6136689.1 hypothetical protein [Longispora fulva]
MTAPETRPAYQAMSVSRLSKFLSDTDEPTRWRLVAEFLKEYRWEPRETRHELLADEPPGTGDDRWDVLLAALAEHLTSRDGRKAPAWADQRHLRRFWFPYNTPAARVDAFVHAPAAFRSRGVFLADHELDVA